MLIGSLTNYFLHKGMRGENGRLIESDYRFNYVEERVGVEVGGADMFFFFYPRDNHLIRFPPFFHALIFSSL